MYWRVYLTCDVLQILAGVSRNFKVYARAGRSPKFQDPGTPLNGLAGTRVPVNLMGQILKESFYLDSDPRVSRGLAGTRVPGYPIPALVYAYMSSPSQDGVN